MIRKRVLENKGKKGGSYPLICSLDLQYLNITIRFYWKEKEKGFVREWLKSWGKLESDDANHSLLVGKTWIGKISHKRYFQQLQPRTNLILPRKIFKFQLLCRLEIKAQELDDYRGEEFEIFQTNWRRKIGYICFLAVQNSSIGDLVTDSVTQSLSDFLILTLQSDHRFL